MSAIAALVLVIAVQAAAALLVVSARRHHRNRGELAHHLRRHRVIPGRAVPLVSRVLPATSFAIGVVLLVPPTLASIAAPAAWLPALRVGAGLEAALYLAFLGYLGLLRRRAPGEGCGCLGAADERTGTSLARAGLASVAAILTAFGGPVEALSSVPGWRGLYVLAGALGALAGVLATALPAGGIPQPRTAGAVRNGGGLA